MHGRQWARNGVGLWVNTSFIPGFREDDADLKQIGYLLLDETLGEYDVESRLGLIKMLSPASQREGGRYPLRELAARFDELIFQLERRFQCLIEIGNRTKWGPGTASFRLPGWFQWVDATLRSNPHCHENKS